MTRRNASVVAVAVLALAGLVSCLADEWSGFVYPDKNNLAKHQKVGVFSTLEQCRDAARAAIDAGGWRASADYECGLNCKASLGPDGPMVCSKTAR